MRTRTLISILAVSSVLLVSGCSGSKSVSQPAGPPVLATQVAQITMDQDLSSLKGHSFYKLGDISTLAAQIHFVAVDTTQPKALPRAEQAITTLGSLRSGTIFSVVMADPMFANINPVKIVIKQRSQRIRYVVLTDNSKLMGRIDAAFGASDSSNGGGTLTDHPDFALSVVNTRVDGRGRKDYFEKAIVTEMCQASIDAAPTTDTVDRAMTNANAPGSTEVHTRDDVTSVMKRLAQENFCNSFGEASYMAHHGKSYSDYSLEASNSGLALPGSPTFVVFDESLYRSVA